MKRNTILILGVIIFSTGIILLLAFKEYGDGYFFMFKYSISHWGLIHSILAGFSYNPIGLIFIAPIILLIISVISFIMKQTKIRFLIICIFILLYFLNLYYSTVALMGI